MKQEIILGNWSVKGCGAIAKPNGSDTPARARSHPGEWIAMRGAMQVHQALMQAGVISGRILEDARGEDIAWVSEQDWAYRCVFENPGHGGRVNLVLKGLDTVCDIYLNDELLGGHATMYLPFVRDITGRLQQRNELLVYFHSHGKMLRQYEAEMPEEWRGHVPPGAMLRKAHDYAAPKGFRPIGIFDDALLALVDGTELTGFHFDTAFDLRRALATVSLHASGSGDAAGLEVEFLIAEEDGSAPLKATAIPRAAQGEDGWEAEAVVRVENPKLWYPRNLGGQPLYRISCAVSGGGARRDAAERLTGFRFVRQVGSMKFEINGMVARLWGADFAPIWGPTNQFCEDKALFLARRYADTNATFTRMWGPTKPYGDALYQEFDRRGILVWQDFPTGGSELPDSKEYTELFLAEAAHMIRRLGHHPSILLWNGGNENIYMSEYNGTESRIGFELLTRHFRRLCMELDPHRHYHASSPYEGRYANDPSYGDSHGSRAFGAYMPGEAEGILFTEDIRTFPPALKSFRRWAKDAVWEDGYVDTHPFGTKKPMPKGWADRLGNKGEYKLGPIGDYYSGENAYELIYKFTMAAAADIYGAVMSTRRGNPPHMAHRERGGVGHMFWKFNDPWPHFYCSMVDYYGENTMMYYAMKRAFDPVKVDIEVRDRIYVWGINDTGSAFDGTLEVAQFDLRENRTVNRLVLPVGLGIDQSRLCADLDAFSFIRWQTVLYACLKDSGGHIVSRCHSFVARENILQFPPAKLEISFREGRIWVETGEFARCVELSGGDGGDEFGWEFEDNYFDLLPFERRAIAVKAPAGGDGIVCAKPRYSDSVAKTRVR